LTIWSKIDYLVKIDRLVKNLPSGQNLTVWLNLTVRSKIDRLVKFDRLVKN